MTFNVKMTALDVLTAIHALTVPAEVMYLFLIGIIEYYSLCGFGVMAMNLDKLFCVRCHDYD